MSAGTSASMDIRAVRRSGGLATPRLGRSVLAFRVLGAFPAHWRVRWVRCRQAPEQWPRVPRAVASGVPQSRRDTRPEALTVTPFVTAEARGPGGVLSPLRGAVRPGCVLADPVRGNRGPGLIGSASPSDGSGTRSWLSRRRQKGHQRMPQAPGRPGHRVRRCQRPGPAPGVGWLAPAGWSAAVGAVGPRGHGRDRFSGRTSSRAS